MDRYSRPCSSLSQLDDTLANITLSGPRNGSMGSTVDQRPCASKSSRVERDTTSEKRMSSKTDRRKQSSSKRHLSKEPQVDVWENWEAHRNEGSERRRSRPKTGQKEDDRDVRYVYRTHKGGTNCDNSTRPNLKKRSITTGAASSTRDDWSHREQEPLKRRSEGRETQRRHSGQAQFYREERPQLRRKERSVSERAPSSTKNRPTTIRYDSLGGTRYIRV